MAKKLFLKNLQTTKTIFSATLITLLLISLIALFSPPATAHEPPLSIPSYAYIIAFPNPVGVGQPISLFAWTATYPPTAQGEYGDHWLNLTINVMQPDGTNTTLGPFESDPVGTIFTTYTPTEAGNYTFQFIMPAYTMTGTNPQFPVTPPSSVTGAAYINDTFEAALSTPVTVVATDEPIPGPPNYPLPTDYWTQPVSQAGHQSWAYIMGDWLAAPVPDRTINDYTQPPTTAHILWTKPINFGGVGGQPNAIPSSGDNYYSYLSYEGMFNPPILMAGRLYYNTPNPPEYGFKCVDLQTGEDIWYNNGTQDPLAYNNTGSFAKQNYPQLSFGQELSYESPNQHGLINYLWSVYTAKNGSNIWAMYDPFTGNWICDIVGVPASAAGFGASSLVEDEIGSYLIYTASNDFKNMTVWNSTKCIQNTNPSLSQANGYWMWRPPLGGLIPASIGNTLYNITGVPAEFQRTTVGPFGASNAMGLTLIGIDLQKQVAIYSNATSILGRANFPTPTGIASIGISIAPDSMGEYLWSNTELYPAGNITMFSGFTGNGVYTFFEKETTVWRGYNSTTGEYMWTTQTPEVTLHSYGVTGGIYNDVLYSGDSIGEGGVIYAYDITNGNLLWQSTPIPMGNTGYWDYVPMSVGSFAAGNIYWYGSEHSPGPNLEPGFKMGAMNASNGEVIWNITFWKSGGGIGGGIPIASQYMTELNAYDNQIYCFGRGPTQTTLQTPLTAITSGAGLIIQGTVMDISAGTTQTSIAARFPNGVPVVSDADQTPWMEYVYMQNPAPTSASGVPVTLTFIDPNGNTHVDTVTTQGMSGAFSYVVPSDMIPVDGLYTVVASFDGTGAYAPSVAQSSLLIGTGGGGGATPTPTGGPTSTTDQYFLPFAIAIIIILIVGIALIMLMLRKRP